LFLKYTKPADEHHLQAFPTLRKPIFSQNMTNTLTLKLLQQTRGYSAKPCHGICRTPSGQITYDPTFEQSNNFVYGRPTQTSAARDGANTAPYRLARPGQFPANYQDKWPAGTAPVTVPHYTRGPLWCNNMQKK
jgi:hypothetical protein